MYGYGWHFFGMAWMWWIFWFVAVVVFFALVSPSRRRRFRAGQEDPLELLKWRYARGELTSAEYDERRERLLRDLPNDRRNPPPSPPSQRTVPPGEHASTTP